MTASEVKIRTKFDSQTKEMQNYLSDLHQQLSHFIAKKKEEKKQWLFDLEKNSRDNEQIMQK